MITELAIGGMFYSKKLVQDTNQKMITGEQTDVLYVLIKKS